MLKLLASVVAIKVIRVARILETRQQQLVKLGLILRSLCKLRVFVNRPKLLAPLINSTLDVMRSWPKVLALLIDSTLALNRK